MMQIIKVLQVALEIMEKIISDKNVILKFFNYSANI